MINFNYALVWTTVLVFGSALQARSEPPGKDAPLDTQYLRDHAQTRGFMLGRPVRAKPTPDGKAVLFLRGEARVAKLKLYEFDVETGKTRELLSPEKVLKGAEERLSPEEKARRERQRVSVGGFTDFQLSEDGSRLLVSLSGKLYLIERASDKVSELKTGSGTIVDPKFSPDSKKIAYVLDYDVYAYDLATGVETRVTKGGTEKRSHGLAEFVAQEEMGRFSGYWWSPDSKQIVYEDADAEGVEIWYVADAAHPEQAPQPSFYPRPGKANVKVRLGVVGVEGGETVWLDWDREHFPYMTAVRWPREGPLTICVQTRDQKDLQLLNGNAETGRTTVLLVEHDDAWLNLSHDGPRWLDDGNFLWTHTGANGPELHLREKNGKFLSVLVPASHGYSSLVDVDAKAGTFVYRATTDPTQMQLYRQRLDDVHGHPLTSAPGLHDAVFSRNHAVYVHQASSPTAMPIATVHRADGTQLGILPSVAEDPPFIPKAEMVKVGGEPGFYGVVIRPRNFEASKRYPVIDHVYGGPTHQQVLASMGTQLIDQWLADQGFIVVSLDNHGTPNRGREWERVLYKHFGSVPLDDQAAGLHALAERFPEMDAQRAGVFGWSFGGYLSALAVLRRPDVFKAAVAGAPVTDWLDYDTHYTERYLGMPETDAEAYKEASLLTYAADLKRPLLLVHGTADDNVFFRHTLKLSNALFRAGKSFDILPLSGLTHMVPDPVVTSRLHERFALFFRDNLGKPEARAAVK